MGSSASSARVRVAVRNCPMLAAALMPLPITSPMTSTMVSSGPAMASNQSPPISLLAAAGRYR